MNPRYFAPIALFVFLVTGGFAHAARLVAPLELHATSGASGRVDVSWTDPNTGEKGYRIERSERPDGGFSPLAVLETDATSYTDLDVIDGRTYYYRLRATGGKATWSAPVGVAAGDGKVPAAASGLAAVGGPNRIDLTWSDNATGELGFRLERSATPSGPFEPIAHLAPDASSFADQRLEPGQYSYRVVVFSAAGNAATSNVVTVATSAASIATPSALQAAAEPDGAARLSWSDNSSNETRFTVERATSADGPWQELAETESDATSATDGGLGDSPNAFYRVSASNDETVSAYSNLASSGKIPNPPSNLTATAVSSSRIDLSWTDNSSNPAPEDGFKIERCTGTGCTSFAQVATVGANVRAWSNTGLAGSTTYVYRVSAYNTAGSSAPSNVATATTPAAAPTIPTAPSGLSATAMSSSQIDLRWTDGSGNEDGFKIERCTGAGCTSFAQVATVGANVTSWSNTALTASTSYSYRVRAYNAAGNSGYTNTASATTQASAPGGPNAPTGLTATTRSSSQIDLHWTDGSANEDGFKIERCTGTGCTNFAQIATVGRDVNGWANTALTGSTSYSYRVRAYNVAGDSGYTNTASATTQASTATVPSAPSVLIATPRSSSQIDLSWVDGSSNEDGFKIERCAGPGCTSFAQVATVGANVTMWSNTALAASTSYSYRVRAYNTAGDSGYSNTASGTTQASAPTIPGAPSVLIATPRSSSQIDLAWTDGSGNEDGFKIERCTGAGCTSFAQVATVGANVTSWSNTLLAASTSYSYRVRSYNTAGDSGYTNTASAITQAVPQLIPSGPTGLSATAASASQIDLGWTDGSNNEDGFKIERCTGASCTSFAQVATVGANVTNWSSTSLAASTSYSYRVRSYNTAGDSGYSNTASATTQGTAPATGQYVWSKDFGGTVGLDQARGNDVVNDAAGNLFVVGRFRGTVNFGGVSRTTAGSDYDAFIAKYSASTGDCLWVKQIGGTSNDEILSAALDGNGDLVVGGYFAGTVDFGAGPLTSAGYNDGFVGKFTGASGAHVWSRRIGGTTIDSCTSVATDGQGNAIATGYFQGTVDMGNGPVTSAGGNDIFLAKYSSTGAAIWSKRIGSTGTESGEAVAADSAGNVSLLGTFEGSVDFGGGARQSAGGRDIYVARYSATGSHLWSQRFGDPTGETARGIAAGPNGEIVITGEIYGTVDFGKGPLVNSGSEDTYLVKFDAAGTTQWSKQFGTTTSFGCGGKAVAIDSAGNIVLAGGMSGYVDLGGGILVGDSVDPYVAKYSTTGAHIWSKRFTGAYGDESVGVSVDGSGAVTITGSFYEAVSFGGPTLQSPWPTDTDGFIARYQP